MEEWRMSYLSVLNVSKTYSYTTVLNGVSLVLNGGQRIGLVGANGVGKSTLLKIITGEVEADSGSVTFSPGMRVGYLAQVIDAADDKTLHTLIADSQHHLVALERRMRALESQMAHDSSAMLEYGDVAEQFERGGGYALDSRVDAVLDGLGVGHIARDRLFVTLSGGEKSRVALATLLLQAPDVLLLDEPTNHLDFAAMAWLEDTLRAYRGAVMIVSHDRLFLNRTVTAIVEIDEHSRSSKTYAGDYDSYLRAKRAERRKWEQDFARQQETIKMLRMEIKVTARRNDNYRTPSDGDKFIPFGKKQNHDDTVAKRVHSAEEKLRRIEADPVARPPEPLHFHAGFAPQMLKGRHPLVVNGLGKQFGARRVLEDVTFTLGAQDRVVIVGVNGAGKSTLLKLLACVEQPDTGAVTLNPAVRLGYLDQEGERLNDAQTVFEAYAEGLPESEQQLKATLLKSGLFRYDEFDLRVGQLSTGQRRKLQIARLIAARSNLLMLDEPTNHVSFDVLESLEDALELFPGPILAVSHDRRFIDRIARMGGQVWTLHDGRLSQHAASSYNLQSALP
jgi:macrolide transport system ATP-binding/permease protein